MVVATTKARKIRDRLLTRRNALLHRYRDAVARADEELSEPENDVIDVANDQWDVRVLSATNDVDANALAAIVGALERLSDGSYGICVGCGARIPAARLAVLPE